MSWSIEVGGMAGDGRNSAEKVCRQQRRRLDGGYGCQCRTGQGSESTDTVTVNVTVGNAETAVGKGLKWPEKTENNGGNGHGYFGDQSQLRWYRSTHRRTANDFGSRRQ